jgi:plastocyanin
VTAREFGFTLSRTSVKAGRVTIELVNFGEDDHDLALASADGKSRYVLPLARPGSRTTVTVSLRKGTYRLVCTVGDHTLRGMKSSLRVR